MTGRDFVATAEHFAKGTTEGEFRSAVSRAYYGAFHEAIALLNSCGVWLPKTEQVHIKLEYCLRGCGDPNASSAGREIELLRAKRKAADYDLTDKRFLVVQAVDAEIKRAQRILETIEQLQSKRPSDFRSKIRAHAKSLGLTVSD